MTSDLDTRLRSADPLPPGRLAALDTDRAAMALRDAILATSPAEGADASGIPGAPSTARAKRPLRRRLPLLVAASAALGVAAVIGYGSLGAVDGVTPTSNQAWAAEAVRVANAVPRLLVGEPGWRVSMANEFSVEDGNMYFASGNRSVELTWIPKSMAAERFKDRADGTTRFPDVPVDGTTARVFRYSTRSQDYAALWVSGDYLLELRTNQDSTAYQKLHGGIPAGEGQGPVFTTHFTAGSFRSFVASMHPVSVDRWLSAMPARVVKPGQGDAAVRDMLKGIPVPDGFDVDGLAASAGVRDRYQLGARVTGAVACSWARQWASAITAGDTTKRDEATRAMAGSRQWPILTWMKQEGAWSDAVWETADLMATNRIPAARAYPDGKPVSFQEQINGSLGCGPHRP